VIMVIMQYKILPIAAGLGGLTEGADIGAIGSSAFSGLLGGGQSISAEELARPFFWLLIMQGLFAGLVIGKLSEGKVKAGLKHSFIFIVLALLINTGSKVFLG